MIVPRWYQEQAVESVFNYFEQTAGNGKERNPVIAIPTGCGKSLILAMLIQHVLSLWSNQRFLVLTHVKELIEQNYNELQAFWPGAPAGIYSAGLKQKDTMMPVIFGGVGSVANNVEMFGWRDILCIDEAHLLSPNENTQYQKVIAKLKIINPNLRVIGLTATPFRLGQGNITNDGIFTDICYDATSYEMFNRLIYEGFLAPLVARPTSTVFDVSNVKIQAGDFVQSQVEKAVDRPELTQAALTELCYYGMDRQSWLVFASGIQHAEHIADGLNKFGVPTAVVHSKMPAKVRDERVQGHKSGKYRALVNNGILTTGYNHKPIDLIGMLRWTASPGLWVQIAGRGTRPSPETGKTTCLLLDFAGNTRRLGPINDPKIPRKKGKGTGDVPVKICPKCGVYQHARATICDSCGYTFEFASKLIATPSAQEPIRSDEQVIEYFNVQYVTYRKHEKADKPPSLKVSYFCLPISGGNVTRMFSEWVLLQHTGFASKRAQNWWTQRYNGEVPATVDEALPLTSKLVTPKRIRVLLSSQFPEILGAEF